MPSSITIEGISNNLTGYGFLEGKKYQFSYASIGDVLQFETLGRGSENTIKFLQEILFIAMNQIASISPNAVDAKQDISHILTNLNTKQMNCIASTWKILI
jgi:hypothetical protein